MNKYKFSIVFLVFAILFATACEDRSDLTAPGKPNTGSADFTRFVTIGNSLTQGVQSNAVFATGQEYSFSKQIAKQVGTTFEYVVFGEPGSGGRMEVASISPFAPTVNTASGEVSNLTYQGLYNNLGVSGAFLYDVLNARSASTCYTAQPPIGVQNPMFDAVLRGLGTQLEQAIAQNPTFVTLWIGNNDILGFATRGGVFPVTTMANFQAMYGQILDGLANTGADVVVANIPDVTSIPFLNTVGPALMASGVNVVVGTKADGTVAAMSLSENYLTLQASAELSEGKGTSPSNPLSNGVILDKDEVAIARQVVAGYNQIIAGLAAAHNFAVVDVNSFFSGIAANGLTVDGLHFTAQYVLGGLFSLDGVHPTSRGYAIVANEFIKVINSKFSAQIPLINVSTIPASLVLSGESLSKKDLMSFPKGFFDNILF